MEVLIDSLVDEKCMSILDCNSGYCKIPLKKSHRDLTTLLWHDGTYRFNIIPFGLTNAPATFQPALGIGISGYKWKTFLVYVDDRVIFSKDSESHFKHIDPILSTLHNAHVTIKFKKCSLGAEKVRYLGHVIETGRLSIDKTVTQSLKDADPPRN